MKHTRTRLACLLLAAVACSAPAPDPDSPLGRARAAFDKGDLNGTFKELDLARRSGTSTDDIRPLADRLVGRLENRLALSAVKDGVPFALDPGDVKRRRDVANQANIADYLAHALHLAGRNSKNDNILMRLEAPADAVFDRLPGHPGFAGTVSCADLDGDGRAEVLVDGRRVLTLGPDGRLGPSRIVLPKLPGNGKKNPTRAGLMTDVDGDGQVDILQLTGRRLRLLLSTPDGGFRDATPGSGLESPFEAAVHSAAFGDIDGDGRPDLYVGAYEKQGKERGQGAPDRFFLNLGEGKFRDETKVRNLVVERDSPSRAITFGDIDNDGDLDLFVGNYRLHPNRLWINADGEFTDEARERNCMGIEANPPADLNPEGKTPNYCGHTIGGCFGDIDNDGDLDLLVGNLAHPRFISFSNPSSLLINPGLDDAWEDVFGTCGLRYSETHSDVSMADVDNDGDLDVFITAIYPSRPSRLFLNTSEPDGPLRFRESTWHSGILAFDSWGHSWTDFDGDGDLDLLVASRHDGLLVFRNRGVPGNAWLRVAPLPAIPGTRVTVSDGKRSLIRDISVGRSFAVQDEPVAHFGFGAFEGDLHVTVTWPDGKTARRTVPPGRRIEVRPGS